MQGAPPIAGPKSAGMVPELNPIETVWTYPRGTEVAHRFFDSYDDIVIACCDAWNTSIADQNVVRPISTRHSATCQH